MFSERMFVLTICEKMLSLILSLIFAVQVVIGEPGLVGSCRNKTITTVSDFQPLKYLGTWYEIGHSRSFYFDHGCEKTFAQYKQVPKAQTVSVNNTCYRDGVWKSVIGEAVLIGSGKFLVSFFGPFESPYDIVYLSDDYSTSLVVSCSELGGSNIWVLHREPVMDDGDLEGFLNRFRDLGFSTHDFVRTVQ